jgi:hypothetical protein
MGVFTADAADAADTADAADAAAAAGPATRLRLVPGLPPAAWSLLSVDDGVLAGVAFGLFEIPDRPGAAPRRVAGSGEATPYTLLRSRTEPSRVWAGTEEGLAAVRRIDGEWRFEAKVAGVTQEVRGILEGADGVLWCATNDGPLRVEIPPASPKSARSAAATSKGR